MNQLMVISRATVPSLVAAAGERAGVRFLEASLYAVAYT